MNKKVFIILLNYNGYKDTLEAIKSLEKINYNDFKIVVVDNNSTDNSFNILKEEIKDKHYLIQSGKNNGFAFGNNVGIKFALEKGADYVLLINNDTEVEKDFLNILVEDFQKDEKIGLTTGLILNYYDKSKVWYAGGKIKWDKFYGAHLDEDKRVDEIELEEKEVSFATGCLMLIKKEVFENIGLLPEEYFMYYEDVDFCAKLLNKGYKIHYNPKSIIYHKISAASGESESPFAIEWNTRNRIKFMKKYKNNISKIQYIKAKVFFYITRAIKIIKYILNKRVDKAKALLLGLK